MEMPIRIVITLFVAVIVGLAIITFTNKIVSDAKTDLASIKNDEDVDENKILEISEISSRQLGVLAEDCFNKNYGISLESDICYVLIGDVDADDDDILDYVTVDEDYFDIDLSDAVNAVKIKYNVGLNVVEITG